MVGSASLKVDAVGIMGLADLNRCLEVGLVYPSKKIMNMGPWVSPSITILLQILHQLLVMGNIGLEVDELVFPFILEGTKLLH